VPLLACAALLLAACTPPASAGPSPQTLSVDSLYALSIDQSAVIDPGDVLPLNPVTADANGQVRVVTFTSYTGYRDGVDTVTRKIWVTLVPEVRDSCRGFRDDLALRLEQLLGLPPRYGNTLMVEMTVPAASLFRPTVDPATTTRYPCGDTIQKGCGTTFPASASTDHRAWLAGQMLSSWQVPGGYPFTRLGYTYNWHPGSPRYGASEYLVRENTIATGVVVSDYRAYCGQPVS
jgi:hypothetical protein